LRPAPTCANSSTHHSRSPGRPWSSPCNDGTVKQAGVGVYEITFNTGPTGSKVPLDLENCAVFATTRVQSDSTPEEVAADADVQRLGGARIYVETTRLLPYGDNKITPFLTNVSFDVAAIC
jgi:hypothetical protein